MVEFWPMNVWSFGWVFPLKKKGYQSQGRCHKVLTLLVCFALLCESECHFTQFLKHQGPCHFSSSSFMFLRSWGGVGLGGQARTQLQENFVKLLYKFSCFFII